MNIAIAKNLSLATMTVSINTLNVNNKQMTLAVFRQIPIMEINKNCHVWGIVKYEIKDFGDTWLVFSFNLCLYKYPLEICKPKEWIYSSKGRKKNDDYEYELDNYENQMYYINNYPQLFIAV